MYIYIYKPQHRSTQHHISTSTTDRESMTMLTKRPVHSQCHLHPGSNLRPSQRLGNGCQLRVWNSNVQLVRLALPPPQGFDHVNWHSASRCCRCRPYPKAVPGILVRLKTCRRQGFSQLQHQLRASQRLTTQEKKWSLTVTSPHQVRQQCCDRAERQPSPT